jgi:hypothetical protein
MTLVMGSVPVGVGAAVAAGLNGSAVFQSVSLALVELRDVVARVAMNKRLSTITPITHFQKRGFLVTGVSYFYYQVQKTATIREHLWAWLVGIATIEDTGSRDFIEVVNIRREKFGLSGYAAKQVGKAFAYGR